MAGDRPKARDGILDAAEALIREKGARSITVEGVAKAAGCAKGLVHYHFKTKRGLLSGVAERLAQKREESWQRAFRAPSARAAIDRTWSLLTSESKEGVMRAWTSLFESGSELTDQTVKKLVEQFSGALSEASVRMLTGMGLVLTVPEAEIGWLLAAVIHGMGSQLSAGANEREVEGAYAAAWVGILSLTQAPS